jgi:hypothetical protein
MSNVNEEPMFDFAARLAVAEQVMTRKPSVNF